MNNPFELLLPQEPPQPPSFRFGTVVGLGPIRVRLDGDTEPVPSSPTSLEPVKVGDRVMVSIYNRRLVIMGVVGGSTSLPLSSMRIVELEGTENLNDILTGGLYHQAQNTEAATSRNYPANVAGLLEVYKGNQSTNPELDYIYQRYTAYNGAAQWWRTKYGNTWHDWKGASDGNYINVNGTRYQATGLWNAFTTPAWTSSGNNIYATTRVLSMPYTPPSGWGFQAYLLNSSGFTLVSTVNTGADGGGVSIRILQFFNATQYTIRVGWRLVYTDGV